MKRELEHRMREEFAQLSRLKNEDLAPRWSNGWMWQGKPFKRPVYLEVNKNKLLLFIVIFNYIHYNISDVFYFNLFFFLKKK